MDKVCTTREINHVREASVLDAGFLSPSLATFHNLSNCLKNICCSIDRISVCFFLLSPIHKFNLGYWWVFYDLQEFKNTPNYREYEGKMPTERCAKLMVVGMANNLDELWISNNPMLLMTYANQYFPTVFKWYEFSVRTYLFLHALESLIRNFNDRLNASLDVTVWEEKSIMEDSLTTRQHLKDMQ